MSEETRTEIQEVKYPPAPKEIIKQRIAGKPEVPSDEHIAQARK